MEQLLSTIESFTAACSDAGVQCLVVGGYAASHWGTPRFTADINFAIVDSAFADVESILTGLGYKRLFLHPKGSFAHFGSSDRARARIDFIIVNPQTWEKLFADSSTIDLGTSKECRVVSANHLISMKLHAAVQTDRKEWLKDVEDVAEVMRRQRISLDDLNKAGISSKFANEKVLTELESRLAR